MKRGSVSMRIKKRVFDRAFEKLYSVEFSIFMYLIRRQDTNGIVENVRMTDMIDHMPHTRQGVYSAFYRLHKKGFIHIDMFSRNVNFDVLIIDNKFDSLHGDDPSDEIEPYINLNHKVFEDGTFYFYNAPIKKFIVRILSFSSFIAFSKDKLKEYGVFKHLKLLRELFDIRTTNTGVFEFKDVNGILSKENNLKYRHLVYKYGCFIEKHFRFYDHKQFDDVIQLISNHFHKLGLVVRSLRKLVKYDKGLKPALFNAILEGKVKYEVQF